MDERIAGQLTLLSFYRRYVIAETHTREARKWGVQRAKAHKNLDFVLEKPENEGLEAKKRTKTQFLCSGGEPASRVKWHLSAT